MYRLKLKADGSSVDSSSTAQITDTIPYLHEYRIRDLAIAPTGDTLFLAIDSSGSTSGPTGGFSGRTVATKTPGFILRMVYMTILPEGSKEPLPPETEKVNRTLIYPNPAADHIHVLCRDILQSPFLVELFDMSGRMVLTQTFPGSSFDVPLQNIRNGLYIFRLFDARKNSIVTKKILVLNK
jgi:hypothetical protein